MGGVRKDNSTPEQYRRQLAHSRAWKDRNRESVRAKDRDRARRKREEGK